MKIEPYNFRKPSRMPSDLELGLAMWLRAASALATENCVKKLSLQLDTRFQGVETERPVDVLGRLPDETMGYSVELNSKELVSLLVISRRLVLALVAGMLGEQSKELPPDRELTPVDVSLWEFLMQHILASFRESWTGRIVLAINVEGPLPQPKRSRLFSPSEVLVVCDFCLSGAFGEQSFQWLVPQAGLNRLFFSEASQASESNSRPQLEHLVRDMPVEICVRLGEANLDLSHLARLQPGDVVVLDQPVSESLLASIDGEPRYRVWPGRVGQRQAFQVESMVGG